MIIWIDVFKLNVPKKLIIKRFEEQEIWQELERTVLTVGICYFQDQSNIMSIR